MHIPHHISLKRKILSALLLTAPMLMHAQNISVFHNNDFEITHVSVYQDTAAYQLVVSIFFKQTRAEILPYPGITLVTNRQGDTIGTGYTEYFAHEGQDTVDYHVQLEKKEIPDFTALNYYFGGYANVDGDWNLWSLKYSGEEKKKPEAVSLDASKLSITNISVYDPKVILPELKIYVALNVPDDKMLLQPYLKCISKDGKIIGEGYVQHNECAFQRGQDTLIYHLFLDKEEIPDFSKCTFVFCYTDPATKKESKCELFTKDHPQAPAKKSKWKREA